jgi:hypothetical protein
MNKKWTTILTIVILLAFIGYIILDATLKREKPSDKTAAITSSGIADKWTVSQVFVPEKGQLEVVAVADNGNIIIGGESFIACYDPGFKLLWEYKTEMPVTALTVNGNNVYGAIQGLIIVINMKGEKIDEWGPFEDNSIITSLGSNESYVTFADAANRLVFILDKKGIVKSTIGNSGEPFIIPSPYFEVALGSDNILYVANTGNRRIEKRNINGALLGYFGKPGDDPGSFCGCCNPAHFTLIPGGFVTAEKGINRIKILNDKGEFVEFVSSVNNFVRPLPLDIASKDGQIIYAANPADSKVYVFKRK